MSKFTALANTLSQATQRREAARAAWTRAEAEYSTISQRTLDSMLQEAAALAIPSDLGLSLSNSAIAHYRGAVREMYQFTGQPTEAIASRMTALQDYIVTISENLQNY